MAVGKSLNRPAREPMVRRLRDILPSKIGYGSRPIGNLFRNVPEVEARAAIKAAWDAGIRYFDTAPSYGAGLAERRLGKMLSRQPRDQYVISTKVGRLASYSAGVMNAWGVGDLDERPSSAQPKENVSDYSADATLRSIEGSLKRLKIDRIDIVWVHDGTACQGVAWRPFFESARKGAFRALDRLCDEGVIKGWGLGINCVEPIRRMLALGEYCPCGFLLAGRYTLLDHAQALRQIMPEVARRGLGIVVGGPYSSGALLGGARFDDITATSQIRSRVVRIKAIADRHGVSMKAAGLQFALANPAVAAAIPGSGHPMRVAEDSAAMREFIPDDFWHDLRRAGLITENAPARTTARGTRHREKTFAELSL